MAYHVLAFAGSLRKASTNAGLIRAFESLAPEGVTVEIRDIFTLPLYNEDDELERYPESARALRSAIRAADAILIATPEYNRGAPAVVHNALEWTTRPTGENAWAGKPVYVVGASTGTLGTVNAQFEVKRMLMYLRAYPLGQPEFYVTFSKEKFDAEGTLTDESTKAFIREKAWPAFIEHIDRVR